MKTKTNRYWKTLAFATLGCWALVVGCIYESPLTDKPTSPVNPKLLGRWTATDESKQKLNVQKWNDQTYVISLDGELHRGHHSEVAGLPLVSMQSLQEPVGKWAFVHWKLSADGNTLELRMVKETVISGELKTSAAVRKALTDQARNPELLDKPATFTRERL